MSRAARDALVDARCTRLWHRDGCGQVHKITPIGAASRLQSLESFSTCEIRSQEGCADLAAFVPCLPGYGATLKELHLHFRRDFEASVQSIEQLGAALRLLIRLESLRLDGSSAVGLLPALFTPGAAAVRTALRSLSLSGRDRVELPPPGRRLPGLPALTRLSISHLRDSFFDALAPGSLPALRVLRLNEDVHTAVRLEPFVAASPLLEDLDVTGNFVPDVARLAGRLRALSALELHSTGQTDLAAAPLPQLTHLSLHNEMDPSRLAALLSAHWAASLRSLELVHYDLVLYLGALLGASGASTWAPRLSRAQTRRQRDRHRRGAGAGAAAVFAFGAPELHC